MTQSGGKNGEGNSSSGWGEIQELLQQTQQENTSMRHQLEQLKQENRQLKYTKGSSGDVSIIGGEHDTRTDSEKAAMLGLEGGGRSEEEQQLPAASKEKERERDIVEEESSAPAGQNNGYLLTDNSGDPLLPWFPSSSSEGSMSVLCEDVASGQEGPGVQDQNWDVHSSEEGSVACLQDRIQQMEENHHSVNEELQATLKELSDLQQSVTDLTFGNEKLTEDKGLILDALLAQLRKTERLKEGCLHLKNSLDESGAAYSLEGFEDIPVEAGEDGGINAKDLADSEVARTHMLSILREHSERRDLEEQRRNDKTNHFEETVQSLFEDKKELEHKGTVLRAKLASSQVELEKHQDMLDVERAKLADLLRHQDPEGKLNLELLMNSSRQDREMLELRCRELEEALNETNNHAEKLQLELERVEYQFDVAKQRFDEEMASYSEILRDQEAYKDELETDYGQMREACIELEDACDQLDYDKQQHLKTIADLNAAVEMLRKEKQEMQQSLGEFKRISAEDSAEWAQFQKDLQQTVKIANDYREEAQDEVKRLEKEKADLVEKVKSLTLEVERLKRDRNRSSPLELSGGGRSSSSSSHGGESRESRASIELQSRQAALSGDSDVQKRSTGYLKGPEKDKPWLSGKRKTSSNVKLSVQSIIKNLEKESAGDAPKIPSPLTLSPTRDPLSRRNSASASSRTALDGRSGTPIRSHSVSESKLRRSATVQLPIPSERVSSSSLGKPLKPRTLEDSSAPKETRRSVGTRSQEYRSPANRSDARQTISNVLFRRSELTARKAPTLTPREQSSPTSSSKSSPTTTTTTVTAPRRDSAEIMKDPLAALVNRYGGGGSKRNALLKWCQLKTQGYKGTDVTNFSSSWNDGLAFCALLHNYLPGKIPYDDLNPQDKRRNFTVAFKAAESAGIPSILDIDDMVKMERPDWQSILAYVTSIYKAFGT